MTKNIEWSNILKTTPFVNNYIDTGLHFANYQHQYNSRQLEMLQYFENYQITDTIYQDNEPWTLLKANQHESNATHYLTADNFKNGTLRITKPGYYYLTEDIIFNPDPRGDNSFMPTDTQIANGDYPTASTNPTGFYHMGFFAAITIETTGVILNLGGHSIRQSNVHRLQQRFFACIQLSSAPFRNIVKPSGEVFSQGPSDFGPSPVASAKNVYIFNGKLNASSHHSIHGTENENVFIENLICSNFEVAAIHLNGCVGAIIRDVKVTNGSNEMQVKATYSQARFLLAFLDQIVTEHPTTTLDFKNPDGTIDMSRQKTILQVIDELKAAMNEVFLAISQNKPAPSDPSDPSPAKAAASIFSLGTDFIDGNNYGIVVAQSGPIVGAHKNERNPNGRNEDIALHNVLIENIISDPHEILACSTTDDADPTAPYSGARAVDARGGIIRMTDIMEPVNIDGTITYKYKENVLVNAQIIIAISQLSNKDKTVIPQPLIDWMLGGKNNLHEVIDGQNFYFVGLGDSMGHIMKGSKGLFVQGGQNVNVRDLKIVNMQNIGVIGHEFTQFEHYKESPGIYRGGIVAGVSIVGTHNLNLSHIVIKDIQSESSIGVGIECLGTNKDILIQDYDIENIVCGKTKYQGSEPNPLIDVDFIHIDEESKDYVRVIN